MTFQFKSKSRADVTAAALAASLMLGVSTTSLAQLATSPPVQVPEVSVTAPGSGGTQAPARAPKAPAAAQQDSTPRAAKKVVAQPVDEPAPRPRRGQSAPAAQPAAATLLEPSAVSVAPTGLTTPVEQIGSAVTVVTSQEIEAQQRRAGPDLLRSVPGINVVQTGGPGGLTSIFTRGTNSNATKVLIDGVDVSNPFSSNRTYDFGQLTNFDIDRVEVLRGPQSGLYGADALGGVIVIYTKNGEGPLKVDALVEGGSFGTLNEAVSARGSNGKFSYAFNVSHTSVSDTPVTPVEILRPGVGRVNNSYENWTFGTKLGLEVSSALSFNVAARYSAGDYGFQESLRRAAKSFTAVDQLSTRGEAVWSLYGGQVKNYFGVNYTDVSTENRSPNFGDSNGDGTRIKYDWRSVVEVNRGLTVVAGADFQTEKVTSLSYNAEEDNQGAYVQAQAEPVRNLFLVANVRYDDNENFGGATTYRVAPAYVLEATGTKFKASYGTAFKAPTLSQRFENFAPFFFGNPNLKPEESTGYDVGFEQGVFNNRAQFGATYFRNDITNLINSNATFDSLTNVDKAETSGVEAFASADLTDQLRVRGDYTYTKAINEATGKDLLRRPRNKASVSLGYKPTTALLLSTSMTYIGESFDVNRVTFGPARQGSFTLVNVAADYRLNPNMSLFGRVDNVFDKQYQNPNGFEGTGIGAYAGIKFNN